MKNLFAMAMKAIVNMRKTSGDKDKHADLWRAADAIDALDPECLRQASWILVRFAEELALGLDSCQSPIEQMLLLFLNRRRFLRDMDINIEIKPQRPLAARGQRYRVDFEVVAKSGSAVCRVAIECDGHEFHEKTKGQVQYDKRRDRALQREGLYVLRFAGSEIWHHPDECAAEIIEFAKGKLG